MSEYTKIGLKIASKFEKLGIYFSKVYIFVGAFSYDTRRVEKKRAYVSSGTCHSSRNKQPDHPKRGGRTANFCAVSKRHSPGS